VERLTVNNSARGRSHNLGHCCPHTHSPRAASHCLTLTQAACGLRLAESGLPPPGAGGLYVLPGVHVVVGSWGGYSSAQGAWTHTVPTTSGSLQLAQATLMRLKACCGPLPAGGGLLPPGTGSLHALLGVHGAVGSRGGHSSAHSVGAHTAPAGSGGTSHPGGVDGVLRSVSGWLWAASSWYG
jgi:hypothetical protein